VSEGETGVKSAKAGEVAALVWVEEALGAGDGGQPHRHDLFKDL